MSQESLHVTEECLSVSEMLMKFGVSTHRCLHGTEDTEVSHFVVKTLR